MDRIVCFSTDENILYEYDRELSVILAFREGKWMVDYYLPEKYIDMNLVEIMNGSHYICLFNKKRPFVLVYNTERKKHFEINLENLKENEEGIYIYDIVVNERWFIVIPHTKTEIIFAKWQDENVILHKDVVLSSYLLKQANKGENRLPLRASKSIIINDELWMIFRDENRDKILIYDLVKFEYYFQCVSGFDSLYTLSNLQRHIFVLGVKDNKEYFVKINSACEVLNCVEIPSLEIGPIWKKWILKEAIILFDEIYNVYIYDINKGEIMKKECKTSNYFNENIENMLCCYNSQEIFLSKSSTYYWGNIRQDKKYFLRRCKIAVDRGGCIQENMSANLNSLLDFVRENR